MDLLEPSVRLVALADDGEPRASTDVIAAGMQQNHASVIKLVRRHADSLAVFGGVGFQIQAFETPGGIQSREVAMLNEQQAALLISFMRNNAKVVGFKVRLVREFYRIREALHQRDATLWQRRIELELRDTSSQVRASFGSGLMLERKRELPKIKRDRDLLDRAIQPSLLN